jgi:hypothetical protein
MCPSDTICPDQVYRLTKATQNSENSVWDGLRQLAGTSGTYAVEVYRYSNDSEPVFSKGGTRVLSDRIGLIWYSRHRFLRISKFGSIAKEDATIVLNKGVRLWQLNINA